MYPTFQFESIYSTNKSRVTQLAKIKRFDDIVQDIARRYLSIHPLDVPF